MYHIPLVNDTNVGFRPATFDDIPHVWRIVYHAYKEYIPLLGRTPPTFKEDFDYHVSKGNLWLCTIGDDISAMLILTPCTDHLLIQAMCVDPNLQGNGLGRGLLSFAEHRAKVIGSPELRLYTNSLMERNIRIYRKWGFRVFNREDYPWGRRIHMRKHIQGKRIRIREGVSLTAA